MIDFITDLANAKRAFIAGALAGILFSSSAFATTNLANIELTLAEGASLPLSNEIALEIASANPQKLRQSLDSYENINVLTTTNYSIAISTTETLINRTAPLARHSQDSFVVDINEPSTRAFIDGFKHEKRSEIRSQDLATYVSQYIENPNNIHGFNIASVVAKQKSGDCTEFAVLTTALARSLGIPARIVIGTVLIEEQEVVSAIGHAWGEIWLDNRWVVTDAALYGLESSRTFYIPTGEMTNEGPGFTFRFFELIQFHPKRIWNVRGFNSANI